MVMNDTQTNVGGWAGSVAYKTIMPQWKACFSSDLQVVIKSTMLYTDDVGNSSVAASSVKASTNDVYYLAEYEVFGSNHYANTNEPAQQEQYDYYKAGNSKVKYRSDSMGNTVLWGFALRPVATAATFAVSIRMGLPILLMRTTPVARHPVSKSNSGG